MADPAGPITRRDPETRYYLRVTLIVLAGLIAAGALAATGIAIAWGRSDVPPDLRDTLTVAMLVLPTLTLLRVRGSILCAIERPFTGLLPERLVRDAVALALVGAVVYGVGGSLVPAGTIVLVAVGTAAALAVVSRELWTWNRALPADPQPR